MLDKPLTRIVDLTLRDGEQATGAAFPRKRRLELSYALLDAGLCELEAGIPAMGETSEEDFRLIVEHLPEARIIAWNRVRKGDIEASARAGARIVHIAVPASDIMLRYKLGWDRERALDELAGTLEYCRLLGLEAINALVARLSLPIEYHAHNDLGLASANALAALRAGAIVSVTVGGLGERAGNASLEQVACASALLRGDDLGVALSRLASLNALVSELSGRPIAADKPLIGAAILSHESGILVDGLLKSPEAYKFMRPELIGRKHRFVPDALSGKKALRHCALSLGYDVNGEDIDRLLIMVRSAWSEGGPNDSWKVFSSILEEGFARGGA